MIDYEETKEDAILSLEQQIKQLVQDAFDKGYQCGYKDRKSEPQKGEWISVCGNKQCNCSVCGEGFDHTYEWIERWNFCPNCGARMKGADDETISR